MPTISVEDVQRRIGHAMGDPNLLRVALTHPSAAVEAGGTARDGYERMEYLGDSILNCCVAEILYGDFPEAEEGVLTKLRSYWVSRTSLAEACRNLELHDAVILGVGTALREGGRANARIQASVLEAVVAAVYLDAGWEAARGFVTRLFRDRILDRGLDPLRHDAKTVLQEARQAERRSLPAYESAEVSDGFRALVFLDGRLAGEGFGKSRKEAEQAAARAALEAIEKNSPPRRGGMERKGYGEEGT